MISVRGKFVEWKIEHIKNIGKTADMIKTERARPRHHYKNQRVCWGLEKSPVVLAIDPKSPQIIHFSIQHCKSLKTPNGTHWFRFLPIFTGRVRGKFVDSAGGLS